MPQCPKCLICRECAIGIFISTFQEQCAQYWPESKNSPEKMGSQLSVELLSEGEFEDYICRELKITDLTVSTFNTIFLLGHTS